MIPKILHYCWFGGTKKNRTIKKCMKSWKKYCPDFQIMEWNEENFQIDSVPYVQEAYKEKKWAFVSDYVRHYALEKYGGIYVDTDVEIIKNIEPLLQQKFMGIQSINNRINSGIMMGAEKGDWFCKEILSDYEKSRFINADGSYNLKSVCMRATEIMRAFGFKLENKTQNIRDYIIYSSAYFDPGNNFFERKDLDSAYSIHYGSASWLPRKERMKIFIRRIIGHRFKKLRNFIKNRK